LAAQPAPAARAAARRLSCFSEFLANASLLQDRIRRVAGLDLPVDREVPFGDRAVPNIVIAFAVPNKRAARFLQKITDRMLKTWHQSK
jgi:hypothetical protein